MEVNERLEEAGTEAMLPEVADEASPEETPATSSPAPTPANPSWFRLAYSIEFLIALIAIFTVWSQVGGQGHLDLLPWYSKLACTLALAWCSVRFTAGLVEQAESWSRRTILWLAGIVIVSIAMAGLTYYYHLHEVPDESDGDDTTATTVSLPRWRP